MENVFYYKTDVTWKEGRIGEISEPTLETIIVATPPEFPKGVPNIWSPEHLFIASANVCLMTTFLAVAEAKKMNLISYKSAATGKLEKVDGVMMISEIELSPEIVVGEEKEIEVADRLINRSEDICLISKSMKTKIILNTIIKVG